jgi:hypothetical protein
MEKPLPIRSPDQPEPRGGVLELEGAPKKEVDVELGHYRCSFHQVLLYNFVINSPDVHFKNSLIKGFLVGKRQ